jgi:hypothetical protein
MYSIESKQSTLYDFQMPLGFQLDPKNRWVVKANSIPWDELEKLYANLFKGRRNGNVAKPFRLLYGALIIRAQFGFSDEEVVLQIQENPSLQYFCGLREYTTEPPFSSSLLTHFRKRLTPEMANTLNKIIISHFEKILLKKEDEDELPPDDHSDSDNTDDNSPSGTTDNSTPSESPANEGVLIFDATVAPQNIRYPQDLSLLDEARQNLEKMIDIQHYQKLGLKKHRTYRKRARKEYLLVARKKKKTKAEIRKGIRQQLSYIERNLKYIDNDLLKGAKLPTEQLERLSTIRELYQQQLYMYTNDTHTVPDRIVSIKQPWIRPIVRGKARNKSEFGAKVHISMTKKNLPDNVKLIDPKTKKRISTFGFAKIEETSFNAFNESESLQEIVERYKEQEKHYPFKVLVDRIYLTKANITYCKEHGIRIMGKRLGRPAATEQTDKKQNKLDEIERNAIERKIAHAKGSFSLDLITTRLAATSETAIAMSITAMNISCFYKLIVKLFYFLFFFMQKQRKKIIIKIMNPKSYDFDFFQFENMIFGK